MKRAFFFAVLALFGTMLVFAQERIAVLPFEDMDNVLNRTQAAMFYREFSNEFTNRSTGRFSVVPRLEVEKLFNPEFNFQLSKFSAEEKTAEMERVLNGSQILYGLIGKLGNTIRITISLYTYPELRQLPGGATISVANTSELFNKIPELVQSMLIAITGGGSGGNQPSTSGKTYKVGDTGPAGGIIFYDRGFVADGWRYLEAAPIDFTAEWGGYKGTGSNVNDYYNIPSTDTSVGSGKKNTQLIVDRLKQLGESNRAAQICSIMDVNGYKDWFLPSKDELNLMYLNLRQKGLGNFKTTQDTTNYTHYYWSSSQYNNSLAWHQLFSSGSQSCLNFGGKSGTLSVRAIRAF